MKTVFIIAVFGLISSAIAHFSTFLGINPQKVFPPVWALHVLIFVVWIPVVFVCRKTFTGKNRKGFWRIVTRNAPVWMKVLSVILFAYTFYNYFYTGFILSEGGSPSEMDGKKVLQTHGDIIRELTDEEYELQQAYEVRKFSGHWMSFYSVGMTVLYSRMKGNSNN